MDRDTRARASSYGTSGSNALDERRSGDILTQAHERHRRRTEQGAQPHRDERAHDAQSTGYKAAAMKRRRQWTLAVLAASAALVLAAFMMLRHIEVAKGALEYSRAKDTLAELNTQIDQLSMKIALAEEVTTVKSRAAQKGMGYPAGEQVIRLTLPDLPESVDTSTGDTGDDSFFSAVFRAFGRVSD